MNGKQRRRIKRFLLRAWARYSSFCSGTATGTLGQSRSFLEVCIGNADRPC